MLFGGEQGSDQLSRADELKVKVLVRMRKKHQQVLEHASAKTFRRRKVPTSPPPRLQPAARQYKNMRWLPAPLMAPEAKKKGSPRLALPKETALPLRYILPYYGIGKVVWKAYGWSPINPNLAWDPNSSWNTVFPKGPDIWGDPSDEVTFVRLRLQGPNPFMLTAVDDDGHFELDFSKLFADMNFPATIARFVVDESSELGLRSESITIGDVTHRPSDPAGPSDSDADEHQGWEDAKRIVNALDARYSAFVRHLLNTHLMVGQAFAVAAFTLPVWHPLRPFMDFFTYGTMKVNHYAYDALLTKDSYFIRSNFITIDDARQLINNAVASFDFDEWLAPRDIAKRGIDAIPDHPYVEDAQLIWPAFERIVERHLDELSIGDDDVTDDPHIVSWYQMIRQVLPDSGMATSLTCRQDLEDLMTGLIYNNVIHEVCGNLSPILGSRDDRDKLGINFEHLRSFADPDRENEQPVAAEVLLMDQASFVSSFNVAGNNMMTINADRYIDDPRLSEAIKELQGTLDDLDVEIRSRNKSRAVPFRGMEPNCWEASISF